METLIGALENLHFNLLAFGIQVVLFFALHSTLSAVVYGPLIRARNERDGKIAGRLAEAEALAANARRLQTEYDEQLRQLRQELATQVRETIESVEKQGVAQLAQAREKAGKALDDSRVAVEAQQKEARAGMTSATDKLARQISTRLIETSLTGKAKEQALSRLGGL